MSTETPRLHGAESSPLGKPVAYCDTYAPELLFPIERQLKRDELGLKAGTIVTRNERQQINIDDGTIEVVPAWRFLLELPESVE